VIATVFGAELAIRVVAGPKFDPSVAVLQIQAFGLIATFLSITWSTALLSLHRHRALLVANLIGLGASMAVTLALVPSLGAKGAAIATVSGEVTLAVIYTLAVLRGPESIRVSLGVVPRAGVAVAAATALLLVPGLRDLALVLAATAVYFAVAFAVKAMPPEIVAAFGERLRR